MSHIGHHSGYTIIPPPKSIRKKRKRDTVGIYRVFHRRTNRSYIGQSVQIEGRIRQHFSDSGASLFRQSSKLAMIKRFDWEILEECDRESLNERESYWIDKLNTNKPNGYN